MAWQVKAIKSLCLLAVISVFADIAAGCKKKLSPEAARELVTIALPGSDLNPDGTINERGMKKIEAKAGGETLEIVFVRTRLSDAGLRQLARFPNLRRVQAVDSVITAEGITFLKSAVPEVQVQR